jgi:predicted AlkP superfamily pyrophosphatase or phosphodiesterase
MMTVFHQPITSMHLIYLLTALVLVSVSHETHGEPYSSNIVILLSWDGMRHDFPDRGNYPALKRMETEGIRAGRLTPVYLSNTFPGHVSLATGAEPNTHGIVDNVFYDREKGFFAYGNDADWLTAEPLWVASERQGVKSAVYFWVGSETDWRGTGASYRMAPFDAGRSESDKVNQIIEWLDLGENERPKLIMSYWRGADSAGHTKGPDHPSIAAAVADQDQQLDRLLSAIDQRNLWSRTTLLVVSDHGMTEITESVAVNGAIEAAGLDVRIVGRGVAQHIFLKDQKDRQAVRTVLQQQPHIRVFEGDDIPKTLAAPNRTGDFVIITVPPYTLDEVDTFQEKALAWIAPIMGWSQGSHGYDPTLPDMGGIFFALGNGVTKGKRIDNVHQLEVAPTVTRLLGIEPPLSASREGLSLH